MSLNESSQILDKIDALKVGEEGLNLLAIKIVSRMVKLKSMEDWFHHVNKSSLAWSTSYEDLDVSEEYNALGDAAKLMTLLNLYQDREEYEKCHLINKHIKKLEKIIENL